MRLSVRQREFLQALSQTETLSLDELQLYQRKLLEPLLKHAMTNVPFYRCRLEPVFGNGTFDWNRWREIPTFNRLEARAAGVVGLQTETLPVGNDRWVEEETSRSTSAPLRHRRSNLNDLATRCQFERAYNWWGMDLDQTLALIGLFQERKADPPEGLNLGKWSMRGDGSFVALDMRSKVEQQIQWLQHTRPRYLLTYPSVLRELADYVLTSGRIGLWFDTVATIGEPVSADVRIKTQKAFVRFLLSCAAIGSACRSRAMRERLASIGISQYSVPPRLVR